MSNKESTVTKKAQSPLWPDMSEAEKLQLVQEGYEHGLNVHNQHASSF